MTKEEAGQIILEGAWVECAHCCGVGKTPVRKDVDDPNGNCTVCNRAGYLLRPIYKEAAKMLSLPIPPKPLTGVERIAETLGSALREGLNRPSAFHRFMPPQLVSDEELEKHKKR